MNEKENIKKELSELKGVLRELFTRMEYVCRKYPSPYDAFDKNLSADFYIKLKDKLGGENPSEQDCGVCDSYGMCDHQGAYKRDGKWCYESTEGMINPMMIKLDVPYYMPMKVYNEFRKRVKQEKKFVVSEISGMHSKGEGVVIDIKLIMEW